MAPSLIQPLFDSPIDIVGDIHGEIVALRNLLGHLGYSNDGRHPEGRRLVFLGDLTDRGPDSPAVVDVVKRFVEAGCAQCVLGNHEVNILLNHPKHENKWFYSGEFLAKDGSVVPQRLADIGIRQQVLDFFATLPLALERDDLRVVHACWDDDMLSFARSSSNVVSLYHEHADRIEIEIQSRPTLDDIDKGLLHQNWNPVKILSSGPEERTDEPIEAGGKIRNEKRVRWREKYRDAFCVFGHYSIPDGEPSQDGESTPGSIPRGKGSTFCIDYGVGKRWTERGKGNTTGFSSKLAALSFPDRVVVFDDGEKQPCEF